MTFRWRRSLIGAGGGALAVYVGVSIFILADIRSDWHLLAYAVQVSVVLLLGILLLRQLANLRRTQAALQHAQASLATINNALRFTKEDLKRARQQLIEGLEGLTDGLALYDADDRLVVCNSRYRELFGLGTEFLRPGTRFEEIIRAHVNAGRIPSAVGREDAWVAERLAQHRDPHGFFERLIDGHWYRFSDRPTSTGGTVTIFAQIDELKQREQRLHENQAILQSILDHIPVTVGIVDRERRIVLLNKRLEALYGVALADVRGRNVAEVRPSRYSQDAAAEDHVRVIETGEPILGREDHYATEAGEESWIVSVVPIKDAQGAVRYVLRTTIEVPQLAKANRELADYRAFLIEAERQARMASWYQAAGREDGAVWSENVADVLGLPPERLAHDADFLTLVHPQDRERLARLLRAVTDRPESYDIEYRIIRPDGTVAWIRGVAKVQRDAGGAAWRLIGAVQDITAQKRIEEALRESEARLRDAQRRARLSYWIWDLESQRYTMSEDATELLGVPWRELQVAGDSDPHIHAEDRDRVSAAYRRQRDRLEAGTLEYRWQRPDGRVIWLRDVSEQERDEAGRVRRLLGSIQDVSEQKRIEEALRENQALLLAAQRRARIAYWLSDVDSEGTYIASELMAEVLGLPADAVPAHDADCLKLVHPEDRARVAHAYERAMTGRTAYAIEYRMFRGDGSIGWVRELSEIQNDAAGRPARMIGTIQDITEQKATEQALRDSEARLRGFLEHAPFAMYLKGTDLRYLLVNRAVEQFQGTTAAEICGRTPDQIYPPALAARFIAEDREVLERGTPLTFEYSDAMMSSYADSLTVRFPIFDDHGRIVAIGGVTQDITERKQAERALRESEARLRRAQQQARLAYWSWQFAADRSPEEFRWSPGSGSLLGVADDRMPVHSGDSERVMHPEDLGRLRRVYDEVRAGLDQYTADYRIIRSDGQVVWVREIGEAVRDADGRRIGVEGTLQDITEQHALEEQLAQSQKMEAIGQLTGGIAHDFNNLLAVILGNLELLGEELPGHAGARQKIDAALRSTLRGSDLTHRLLAYARRQPLAPRVTRINALIRNMRDLVLRPLGPTIDVTFVLDEQLWPTEVDQAQLETSLLNLVINARDAMPDGGRLIIETANVSIGAEESRHDGTLAAGDYVCIAVSDSGTGMSETIKARAFDPFFTTKGIGKGTGLGLSMVYGFVKQSGGHIELDSAIGSGTTVRIYLPRTKNTIVAAAAA